jgi:hypothetical protein
MSINRFDHYAYYRLTFYLRGVYQGAEALRCRDESHARRQAEYVKLAFIRNVTDSQGRLLPVFDPCDVSYDVDSLTEESTANCGLATCVS